jgi:hypothetical protein
VAAAADAFRFRRPRLVDGQGGKVHRLAALLSLFGGFLMSGQDCTAVTVLLLLEWLASGRQHDGSHVDCRYEEHHETVPGNAGLGNSTAMAFRFYRSPCTQPCGQGCL